MLHGHGDQIGDGILEFLRQLGRVGRLIRRCTTACAVRMALRRGHQRETLSSSSELGSEPHRGLDIRRAIEGRRGLGGQGVTHKRQCPKTGGQVWARTSRATHSAPTQASWRHMAARWCVDFAVEIEAGGVASWRFLPFPAQERECMVCMAVEVRSALIGSASPGPYTPVSGGQPRLWRPASHPPRPRRAAPRCPPPAHRRSRRPSRDYQWRRQRPGRS
jgi:hypothetical protein